jgi:hypothetical protein
VNNESVDKINELINKIESGVEKLASKVNEILSWVPPGLGFVVDKFKAVWNLLNEKVGELFRILREKIPVLGDPGRLTLAQQVWNEAGGKVSAEVLTATPGELSVDDSWSGTAATQYKDVLINQRNALTAIKSTFTDKITLALNDVQRALDFYHGGIVVALCALVTAIFGAVASGPFAVAALIGGVVFTIGAVITCGTELRASAASASGVLLTLTNERTAFGRDNWPRATS